MFKIINFCHKWLIWLYMIYICYIHYFSMGPFVHVGVSKINVITDQPCCQKYMYHTSHAVPYSITLQTKKIRWLLVFISVIMIWLLYWIPRFYCNYYILFFFFNISFCPTLHQSEDCGTYGVTFTITTFTYIQYTFFHHFAIAHC